MEKGYAEMQEEFTNLLTQVSVDLLGTFGAKIPTKGDSWRQMDIWTLVMKGKNHVEAYRDSGDPHEVKDAIIYLVLAYGKFFGYHEAEPQPRTPDRWVEVQPKGLSPEVMSPREAGLDEYGGD